MLRSVVQTEQIVALLVAERDRLSRAIDALQDGATRRVRPRLSISTDDAVNSPVTNSVPKKRRISAAGRKRIAEGARRRWASIRAAEAGVHKKVATK